jgi:hypothetical protein
LYVLSYENIFAGIRVLLQNIWKNSRYLFVRISVTVKMAVSKQQAENDMPLYHREGSLNNKPKNNKAFIHNELVRSLVFLVTQQS